MNAPTVGKTSISTHILLDTRESNHKIHIHRKPGFISSTIHFDTWNIIKRKLNILCVLPLEVSHPLTRFVCTPGRFELLALTNEERTASNILTQNLFKYGMRHCCKHKSSMNFQQRKAYTGSHEENPSLVFMQKILLSIMLYASKQRCGSCQQDFILLLNKVLELFPNKEHPCIT